MARVNKLIIVFTLTSGCSSERRLSSDRYNEIIEECKPVAEKVFKEFKRDKDFWYNTLLLNYVHMECINYKVKGQFYGQGE